MTTQHSTLVGGSTASRFITASAERIEGAGVRKFSHGRATAAQTPIATMAIAADPSADQGAHCRPWTPASTFCCVIVKSSLRLVDRAVMGASNSTVFKVWQANKSELIWQ